MAAKAEGAIFSYDTLLAHAQRALASNDLVLMEGVGGAFVPLADDKLVSDWIIDLNLPVILVIGSYLGTMSHTIATVKALEVADIKISGIVMSESTDNPPDLTDSCAALSTHVSCPIIPVSRNDPHPPDLTQLLA